MDKKFFRNIAEIILGSIVIFGLGCTKKTELSAGPYFKAPTTAVNFYGKAPNPSDAAIGDVVSFQVTGLTKLKNYKAFINQIQADVISVTDSLITVKVPEGTSSGPGSILTEDGQYFYGPILKIDGKISIDGSFATGIGTNGPIYDVYYSSGGNGSYVLGGNFTDYNLQSVKGPINSIVKINSDGSYATTNSERGAVGGLINSIYYDGGSFLIGGYLSSYNVHTISNTTRINGNLSLDSTTVDLINPDPDNFPKNGTDTVPAFNAYLLGGVTKIFKDANDNVIEIGNFGAYQTYFYERSQKGTYYKDLTFVRNFIRMDNDGVMDSTFNFNTLTGKSYSGVNGAITDAIQLPDGKIIFVGTFTGFNGNQANRIAALNDDGTQDQIFSSAIGLGADGDISKITYNESTHKILITGSFRQFNGHPAKGIAMLNEDGSFDNSFQLGAFEGGVPNYAGQLSNGKVIVSGTFQKYTGVIRQGFMILNADGSLAIGYNNTGAFAGVIHGLIEPNNFSFVVYGEFNLFDNTKVGNIVRISID